VGSRRDCTWILDLSGFRVVTMDEAESGRLRIRIQRRGIRRHCCNGCGRRTGRVRSSRERTWDDGSDGSSVERAGFAPSASSLPIPKRGSRGVGLRQDRMKRLRWCC
jgi:hypothetical protein